MKSLIFKSLFVVIFSTLAFDMLPAEEQLTAQTVPVAVTAVTVNPDNAGNHHRRHRRRIIWRRHHHHRHPWRF